MRSSSSGGALGRLVSLAIVAASLVACGKSTPDCVAGTAGCECAHPQACDEGLECRWDICWGGEVTPPDTYFYTDRSLADYDDTKRLIQRHLTLQPGHHVADIGCGKGSMTVAMSRLIGPTGMAYATDIDPSALERTRENLSANTNEGYSPLQTFLATSPRSTGLESLPDGSIHLMLMLNSVYFERGEDPDEAATYMGRFLRKLAPGGRLIYHFDWIEPQRLTRDETAALMVRAGFSPEVEDISMLPHIPAETFVISGGLVNAVPKPLKRGFISVFKRPGGSGVCPPGSAGCPCSYPQACNAGLSCRWDFCWGGDVPAPDTYFYTDQALTDYDDIRRLIAERAALKPGDHAADVGCGQGSVTVSLAEAVGPTGKIYATDIDPGALTRVQQTLAHAESADAGPVVTLQAKSPRDTGMADVPDGSLALMLMINSVYFEHVEPAKEAQTYLAEFLRKLKPGGRVIYHYDWIDPPRLNRDEIVARFVAAGFSPEVEDIPLPAHIPAETYVLNGGPKVGKPKPLKRGFITVFRRPGGAAPAPSGGGK